MAFKFNWPSFSKEFIEQARQLLNSALNKSNKPANIVDHIIVKELNMGTQAPELEILEIGELVLDKFRGIFKLTYNGDAFLVLQTKVQANPMNNNKSDISTYTRRGILAADQPLVVPMLLRLSDVKLRGIVVLVVSKQKGITLVFKNDPLEKVDVTSTFDGVSSVQRFLQTEIEKRLRIMFQEDLPSIVHQLSLKWLNEDKGKKETLSRNGPSERRPVNDQSSVQHLSEGTPYDTVSMPELQQPSPLLTPNSEISWNISPESSFYVEDGFSMAGGDLESLDGLSANSTYSSFGELFDREKGLKVISQQKNDWIIDGNQPRVFHRQRLMESGKPERRGSLPTWLPSNNQRQVPKPLRRHMHPTIERIKQPPPIVTGTILGDVTQYTTLPSHSLNCLTQQMTTANLQRHDQHQYVDTESSCQTSSFSSERPTTPPSCNTPFTAFQDLQNSRNINNPNSDIFTDEEGYCDAFSSLDNNYHQYYEKRSQQQQEFVLQPSETSVAAQLASLMNSNHTISPYTRTLQHLTFRSYPHPINKKLANKRSKSGVKRNVLKLPGLATSF